MQISHKEVQMQILIINGEIFEDSITTARLMKNLQKTTKQMGAKDLKKMLKNNRRLLHNVRMFSSIFNQSFIDPRELYVR